MPSLSALEFSRWYQHLREYHNRIGTWLLLAVCTLTLVGCSTVNPYYDPSKPHHTPQGFKNNYLNPQPEKFWRWQYERMRDGLPKPPKAPITGVTPNASFIQSNRDQIAMTWVGHSTVLMQIGGKNILTDPHFSMRASPVSFAGPKRHQPPGLALNQLPKIDLVVISHNHYDHLDLDSVRALAAQAGGSPVFAVPLGVDVWFKDNVPGAQVQVFDWWQSKPIAGLDITFAPVQHWSSRSPFDRNATLWGSWVIASSQPAFKMWFSGDLGYSKDTQDIGQRLGPFDFSLIAVGAYEPRWFMHPQHINPTEAVQVFQDVRTRSALGIHWGTFEGLTDESLDQPPIDLSAALKAANRTDQEFFVVRHGQTRVWSNGQWVDR